MISFTSFVQIIFILLDQISLRLNILKRENKMKQKKEPSNYQITVLKYLIITQMWTPYI